MTYRIHKAGVLLQLNLLGSGGRARRHLTRLIDAGYVVAIDLVGARP